MKDATTGSRPSCLGYSPTIVVFGGYSLLRISPLLLDISFLVNCHISTISFFVFFVLHKIQIKFSLRFLLVLMRSDQILTGSAQNLLRTTQILVRSDQNHSESDQF